MNEKKNKDQTSKKGDSPVNRRSFMKGMGISAAIGAKALSPEKTFAKYVEPALFDAGSGILKDSPVVMIWRRVSSLYSSKDFVGKVIGVQYVGQDPVSIMYDAGGALIGYAIQETPPSGDAPQEFCSEIGLQTFSLQNNPASALVFAPSDFQTALRRLEAARGLVTIPSRSEVGDSISFLDEDGNFSSFYRPSKSALVGRAGSKLEEMLRTRWATPTTQVAFQGGRQAQSKTPNPLVGIELMVSDLSKSLSFYKDTLGIRMLEANKDVAKFDIGSVILTLRSEPTSGLVQFLARSGRLLGDWFVFHVKDIKAKKKALEQVGAKFPAGIEDSAIGQVAYFNDPDKYSLVLWQSSGNTKMIDYGPALDRIIREATRPKA